MRSSLGWPVNCLFKLLLTQLTLKLSNLFNIFINKNQNFYMKIRKKLKYLVKMLDVKKLKS